jgi:Pyruvate/2-oxoacid:ferredoxin oxidoreductase delta subunit
MIRTTLSYQEATIYYYTGTGNSYRVAAWTADPLVAAGATVTLLPIESARPRSEVSVGTSALLGLLMPTHGFTTPWAMLRFAFRLPRRSGTHAVVVATRAGMRIGSLYTPGFEGTANLIVAAILALKGYHIRGTAGIDMPSNWIALHPGLSATTVNGIVDRAAAKTARFIGGILSGRRYTIGWLVPLLGLFLLPISLAYLFIGRFFLARLFFASDRCTGCGLCAEHCPNGAIVMRGTGKDARPYWTFRCESCMRCMNFCPLQAVEASHLLALGTYLLAGAIPTAALLARLVVRIPLLAFLSHVPGWVLESVNAILVLALVYPLFHRLLRIGPIHWFFTQATLTHYYRRYHEPGTRLNDITLS